ncbi:MAG: PKD-like domain-containing protein, partial [Cyclobacteriaceae bacterium]
GASVSGTGAALDFGVQTVAGTYTVEATTVSTPACGPIAMSGSSILTVNPIPVITNATTTETICSTDAASFTPIISVLGSTYIWNSTVLSGLVTGVTPTGNNIPVNDVLTNIGSGSAVVRYRVVPTGPSTTFCLGNSVDYVVTVNPEPVGAADSKMICSDVAIDYNLLLNVATLGNNVGSTFSWVAVDNVNPLVTGETLAPTIGPIITDAITNLTNTDQIVQYSVTPTGTNGCIGAQFQITVTVKPEPVGVSMAAPDICSGTVVAYDLQDNVDTAPGNMLPSNFTWTATPNANILGETTSLKSGSIIDDVLVNTTTVDQTVTYTVTPTGQVGGCAGDPFTITVTVNPRAVFTAGPNLSVCLDQVDIEIQGTVTFAPSTYSWSGGMFDNNTLEKPKYILSAADMAVTVPTNRVLTLTVLGAGACAAEMKTMTLTINPLPVTVFSGLPPGAPPQMAENNAPITLTGNQIGGLFTILPITSNIGSTTPSPVDKATFDPSSVDLGSNFITYTYTDGNGCTNFDTQEVIVNPVTNVDFTLQIPGAPPINVPLNPSGQFELCADVGLVDLIGNPPTTDGFPPETEFSSIPAYVGGPLAPIVVSGSNYQLNTTGLASDTYRIVYTFKNLFGAITFKIRDVLIFASPVAGINVLNSCIDSAIDFTDGSTIPATPFPTSITSWQWGFGVGEGASNQQNPSYSYSTSGLKNVTLNATTSQGCANSTALPIRVGDVPIVGYSWSAICNNDETSFIDQTDPGTISIITNYAWDFGDGDMISGIGAIPAGTNGGRTTGTYDNPDHKYASFGTFSTSLTVNTNDGCNNSLPQTVFILPFSTVTPIETFAYKETFELSDGGWIGESLSSSNVSWIWGIPTGANINGAAGGQNVWWTGNNSNSYFANENSVVNGPCFDLRQLDRPMVALDYWSDTERTLDGAVLQYSTDGGLSWRIVGPPEGNPNRDEGIDWFNGVGIVSNPGSQPIGQYGWTDKLGGWKNGRFNLDMIPPIDRDQVRIRIAFSSNSDNSPDFSFDGFAFDNVFVGNKQRNVLVEHFTNSTSTGSVAGDDYLDNLLQQQITLRGTSDFSDIRYHISSPQPDPINLENPVGPGARASYYNVSQSPATVMDGILDGVKFKGRYQDLTTVEVDRRALVDPLFDLVLDTLPTGISNTITARLNLTARKAFNAPLIVQVAIIEKNVDGSKNVLRKQLFGNDGLTLNNPWVANQSLTQTKADVEINVPISNSSQLELVGYVQDKNTKEIYQSVVIPGPVKRGSVIVGIEDEPLDAFLTQLAIYPNPANGQFIFGVPSEFTQSYKWRIADQRGVIMLEGDFENQLGNELMVDVSNIPNGMYHVIISGPGKSATYKKLVVMNRN